MKFKIINDISFFFFFLAKKRFSVFYFILSKYDSQKISRYKKAEYLFSFIKKKISFSSKLHISNVSNSFFFFTFWLFVIKQVSLIYTFDIFFFIKKSHLYFQYIQFFLLSFLLIYYKIQTLSSISRFNFSLRNRSLDWSKSINIKFRIQVGKTEDVFNCFVANRSD